VLPVRLCGSGCQAGFSGSSLSGERARCRVDVALPACILSFLAVVVASVLRRHLFELLRGSGVSWVLSQVQPGSVGFHGSPFVGSGPVLAVSLCFAQEMFSTARVRESA
jgi:hypothetical protein